MKTTLSALLLVSAALGALPAVSNAQAYRVSALAFNGNSDVTPTGIAGDYVVGNVSTEDGQVAAIWGPGGSQILAPTPGGSVLGVYGVNRYGDAVGTGSPGATSTRGIVWRGGVASILPTGDADGDTLYGARASGINDSGTIIGGGETIYGTNGVIWKGDDIVILRGLQADAEFERSSANAINAFGFVAGNASTGLTGNVPHAVVWDQNGNVRAIDGLGSRSAAYGINDRGASVGYSLSDDGLVSAFVNDGTTSTLLPILMGASDGTARDINEAGLIVGSSSDIITFEGIATLWKDGQAIDLNSLLGPGMSDWQLVSATDITDDGTILGFGYYAGVPSSFVLAPVPEPATFAALGLGVAALARRRKARHTRA